jgi:REP element-mobilizing transposase RayT
MPFFLHRANRKIPTILAILFGWWGINMHSLAHDACSKHSRRSLRLKGYDYCWPGWYYATLCTSDRKRWFGEAVGGEVLHTSLGKIVCEFWGEIPSHNKNVEIDDFVVMPDHVHGIIIIGPNESHLRGDESHPCGGGVQLNTPTEVFSTISPKKGSLSVIIRTFKAAVTTWAWRNGFPSFRWQSGFYEHIIRNQKDLDRIRAYIRNNPLRWSLDKEDLDVAG